MKAECPSSDVWVVLWPHSILWAFSALPLAKHLLCGDWLELSQLSSRADKRCPTALPTCSHATKRQAQVFSKVKIYSQLSIFSSLNAGGFCLENIWDCSTLICLQFAVKELLVWSAHTASCWLWGHLCASVLPTHSQTPLASKWNGWCDV